MVGYSEGRGELPFKHLHYLAGFQIDPHTGIGLILRGVVVPVQVLAVGGHVGKVDAFPMINQCCFTGFHIHFVQLFRSFHIVEGSFVNHIVGVTHAKRFSQNGFTLGIQIYQNLLNGNRIDGFGMHLDCSEVFGFEPGDDDRVIIHPGIVGIVAEGIVIFRLSELKIGAVQTFLD
jgi:hypothetical protein